MGVLTSSALKPTGLGVASPKLATWIEDVAKNVYISEVWVIKSVGVS